MVAPQHVAAANASQYSRRPVNNQTRQDHTYHGGPPTCRRCQRQLVLKKASKQSNQVGSYIPWCPPDVSPLPTSVSTQEGEPSPTMSHTTTNPLKHPSTPSPPPPQESLDDRVAAFEEYLATLSYLLQRRQQRIRIGIRCLASFTAARTVPCLLDSPSPHSPIIIIIIIIAAAAAPFRRKFSSTINHHDSSTAPFLRGTTPKFPVLLQIQLRRRLCNQTNGDDHGIVESQQQKQLQTPQRKTRNHKVWIQAKWIDRWIISIAFKSSTPNVDQQMEEFVRVMPSHSRRVFFCVVSHKRDGTGVGCSRMPAGQ